MYIIYFHYIYIIYFYYIYIYIYFFFFFSSLYPKTTSIFTIAFRSVLRNCKHSVRQQNSCHVIHDRVSLLKVCHKRNGFLCPPYKFLRETDNEVTVLIN